MYNWITLLYSRNYHNIINKLYLIKLLKKKIEREGLIREIKKHAYYEKPTEVRNSAAIASPIFPSLRFWEKKVLAIKRVDNSKPRGDEKNANS